MVDIAYKEYIFYRIPMLGRPWREYSRHPYDFDVDREGHSQHGGRGMPRPYRF